MHVCFFLCVYCFYNYIYMYFFVCVCCFYNTLTIYIFVCCLFFFVCLQACLIPYCAPAANTDAFLGIAQRLRRDTGMIPENSRSFFLSYVQSIVQSYILNKGVFENVVYPKIVMLLGTIMINRMLLGVPPGTNLGPRQFPSPIFYVISGMLHEHDCHITVST